MKKPQPQAQPQAQKAEPDLLIESMQKLIDHMKENKTHQEEIFQTLTPVDVQKILSNFDDKSPIMRKTSAAFLCELVYDNPQIQRGFCEITNILPMDGKICVNRIPQSLMQYGKHLPEVFEAIKQAPAPPESPLCWYFEFPKDKVWKKGVKFIKFEKNNPQLQSKQLIPNFVDPQVHLFGFIISKQPLQVEAAPPPVQQRTQASKSTHEEKRFPMQKKARPQSGAYSPMNSVSPMIARKRNLNQSVDVDSTAMKLGKSMMIEEPLSTIDEQVVKKPQPKRPPSKKGK